MATTTGLITVAEFKEIPDPDERMQLYHGQVVIVPAPTMRHNRTEGYVRDALKSKLGHLGYINSEVAFRPLPEYEVWIADVAFLSSARDKATPGDEWIAGAPDLVVEVLSPSNRVGKMEDRRDICLRNGSLQFWVLDAGRKAVGVTTPDGKTLTYRIGDEIDLAEFGGGKLSVAEIFAE
jgi:Uma2 family endonuclease